MMNYTPFVIQLNNHYQLSADSLIAICAERIKKMTKSGQCEQCGTKILDTTRVTCRKCGHIPHNVKRISSGTKEL